MKKIALLLIAVIICLTFAGCKSNTPISNETPLNDPAISNKGKLVLNETMILFIEDGFESDGVYDTGYNPNCQRILSRANRTIIELEQKNDKDIDYEFVNYTMHSWEKIDEYNYLVKITLKGQNSAGEATYIDTDAYMFCVEADTYGGFDLQVHCEGLTEALEELMK